MIGDEAGLLTERRALETPAYVFDEAVITSNLGLLEALARSANLQTLYSVKAACQRELLELVAPRVAGFSVSSIFEARLARSLATRSHTLHLTSPLVRRAEIEEISKSGGSVSFNSLEQLRRLRAECPASFRLGIRVNPGISLVTDERYDPCRRYSKLGVPLQELRTALDRDDELVTSIGGLHFHTNCEARSYDGLIKTVQQIVTTVPDLLESVQWVNIGGGYLFAEATEPQGLSMALDLLKSRMNGKIFFEPGAGVVQQGVYFLSEVVDLFRRDGLAVAVLDASVGHWPEVFEYRFQPDLAGDVDDGPFEYLLAGCSCLAGDVFGRYALNEELVIGSRVAFTGAGAYSLVKENYFNGLELPRVYWLGKDRTLRSGRRVGYEDFAARNGVLEHVSC